MKKLIRFALSLTLSALFCITAPTVTQFVSAALPGSILEQQARSHYSNQQFSEAAKLFQQAAQNYQTSGDAIRQGLSLSNLSLAYQQFGQWEAATKAIEQSLLVLHATPEQTLGRSLAIAQALDIQGSLLLARGQTNDALNTWKRSTEIYQKEGKRDRALISQTSQAQALQNLGLYRRAIEQLDQALALKSRQPVTSLAPELEKVSATPATITALRTLGESLRVVGDFPQAILVLEKALAIATDLKLPEAIALNQLSLGNTLRAQGFDKEEQKANYQAALSYYQKAATQPGTVQVQARLNQLSLLVETQSDSDQNIPQIEPLISQTQQDIISLPAGRTAIEARINLAKTMMQTKSNKTSIAESLAIAIQQAKELGDSRLQSYAIGSLGSLYEQDKQWKDAEKLTRQALQLAQPINARDIAYRWEWQLGRILDAQGGRREETIIAYEQAVQTIKLLREDLAASSQDVQFSFRVAIEPIHRKLVELLLTSNQPDRLEKARKVIEDLQLVELDNFFREACLNAVATQIDQVDATAAVIYPILLKDQLSVIVSLPGDKAKANLYHFKHNVKGDQLEQELIRLPEILKDDTLDFTLPTLQKLYYYLIQPVAAELKNRHVKTLVFVLDGALRGLPMSALHDGQKFLIEDYSIAVAPGLQLLSPKPFNNQNLGAFVAGLSEQRDEFGALPEVKAEVEAIQANLPSRILLDKDFTPKNLENGVAESAFPIVHLATHGEFGARQEDTFILTAKGKLSIADLSSILQNSEFARTRSLELLVLSACQTAQGDPKSALGMAGIAVRSGARSTIATLWKVKDKPSAEMMKEFYKQLATMNQTKISKAEALRQAQLKILSNQEYDKQPAAWASYILIGNWT